MIAVRFFLREPGNHHEIARRRLPAIPREGDSVGLDPEYANRRVHSCNWVLYPDEEPYIYVLVE